MSLSPGDSAARHTGDEKETAAGRRALPGGGESSRARPLRPHTAAVDVPVPVRPRHSCHRHACPMRWL